MKQKYNLIIVSAMFIVLLAGCKKFLTVKPEGEYTEDQVFANETIVQQALNGLYNDMADNALYGANMTNTTLELMAQRWNAQAASDNSYSLFQTYAYTQTNVQDVFESIWQKAYNTILAANKFISRIDTTNRAGVLTQAKADEIKGEAIAIRAFLHFDMLRLFGPVYSTSADQPAIPYYRYADGNSQPIITARQALDSILDDYKQAETLLANDPIVTNGVVFTQDFYAGYRNERMNLYAVQGLMARAYLWGGDSTNAHSLATEVLSQGEKWFPWAAPAAISNATIPDRIFSPEVIFSVYNQDMYTDYTAQYSPDLKAVDMLAPLTARLTSIYENNTNDYRYANWFLNNLYFQKFKDVASTTSPWRFIQPLLRKSELYYIIAETDNDPNVSFNALDTLRHARGLLPLATTAVLKTEIQKEYQKEFWGEGQLFFYYKRVNATSIPSATVSYLNVSMNATKYVVPLPLSETTPR